MLAGDGLGQLLLWVRVVRQSGVTKTFTHSFRTRKTDEITCKEGLWIGRPAAGLEPPGSRCGTAATLRTNACWPCHSSESQYLVVSVCDPTPQLVTSISMLPALRPEGVKETVLPVDDRAGVSPLQRVTPPGYRPPCLRPAAGLGREKCHSV